MILTLARLRGLSNELAVATAPIFSTSTVLAAERVIKMHNGHLVA